jgi:phosphate transport system substrate-binding protein
MLFMVKKYQGKKTNMNRKKNSLMVLFASVAMLAGCGATSSNSGSSSNTSTKDSSSIVVFDTTQKVVPYTRDTTSGTREGFMEKIDLASAKKDDSLLKETVQAVSSNGDMIQKLSADEYGIGYFSHDSITDASNLGVKVLNYEGTEATESNILDGTYKLSRTFNYCIAKETDEVKKMIVDAFVAYLSTSEGLTTIQSNGGIVEIKTTTPSWKDIKANYSGIENDHSSLTINFGGSTSVEKIAKALSADFSSRAGNFQAKHNHTGSGDAYKSTQGSSALTLDIGFASREFNLTSGEPLAEGTYGKICIDGIVVGVSNKNPLTNITASQCKNIYSKTGTITTWSDLN